MPEVRPPLTRWLLLGAMMVSVAAVPATIVAVTVGTVTRGDFYLLGATTIMLSWLILATAQRRFRKSRFFLIAAFVIPAWFVLLAILFGERLP